MVYQPSSTLDYYSILPYPKRVESIPLGLVILSRGEARDLEEIQLISDGIFQSNVTRYLPQVYLHPTGMEDLGMLEADL